MNSFFKKIITSTLILLIFPLHLWVFFSSPDLVFAQNDDPVGPNRPDYVGPENGLFPSSGGGSPQVFYGPQGSTVDDSFQDDAFLSGSSNVSYPSYAPSTYTPSPGAVNSVVNNIAGRQTENKSQAGTAIFGQTGRGGGLGGGGGGGVGQGLIQCGVTQLLSGVIQNIIGSIGSSLFGGFSADEKVPIVNPNDDKKDKGTFSGGILTGVSWDAIGYCLVNIIIAYISQSAVNYINSGFDGNPAFVTDPSQFFSDVSDIQAEGFIRSLGQSNLYSPYKSSIQQDLAQNYLQTTNQSLSQSPLSSGNTLNGLTSGSQQATYSDLIQLTGRNNNYRDIKQTATRGLIQTVLGSISDQQTRLNWSGGYLDSVDPRTGQTTVPGSDIAHAARSRVNAPIQRAIQAQDFDQVIDQLINALISVALDEIFSK